MVYDPIIKGLLSGCNGLLKVVIAFVELVPEEEIRLRKSSQLSILLTGMSTRKLPETIETP